MPYVGRPITRTFTPPVNGTVRVSVVFDLFWSFGPCFGAPFCEQSGVTTYGTSSVRPPRSTTQSLRVEHTFPVVAGSPVIVGLAANGPGIFSMVFTNLSLQAEFTAT